MVKSFMLKLLALIALLFVAPAVAGPAAAQEPIEIVPYRLDYEGAIVVSATIDGRGPYDFIIDTGSTLTLAFDNLAIREQFQPTGGPPRRVLGISGSARLDTYSMGDVALGAAILPHHVGVIIPDYATPRKTPAGIIGLDFLRQYAIVFDVGARTMSFYPHGAIPAGRMKGWHAIKLRSNTYAAASGALYTTKGLINRSPTTFVIDLGSVATLINYRGAEAMFSSVVTRDLGEGFTTGSRLKDVFDDRTRARTARVNRIQVGRATWRNVGVWVNDAPIFDEMGVQRLPFGLLGADLLAAQDFAVDFGEQRLYLSKLSRSKRSR